MVVSQCTRRVVASYAEMYKRDELEGGHVIMLGKGNDQAVSSLLLKWKKGNK